jgi:hypothetical protein
VAATMVDGRPVQAALPLSEELAFVVVIPERDLATPEARGVLPEALSRGDVVFNLGRMGLLVAGLADPDALVPAATDDRLHQPARTTLFPEAPGILGALVDAGGAGSGAGAPRRPPRRRLRGRGGRRALGGHVRSDPPRVETSPCSWVMAEFTLKVLRTWL